MDIPGGERVELWLEMVWSFIDCLGDVIQRLLWIDKSLTGRYHGD